MSQHDHQIAVGDDDETMTTTNNADEFIPYVEGDDDFYGPSGIVRAVAHVAPPTTTLAQPVIRQPQQPGFSERQLALIKSTLAPGIDDDQLALFALVAERTGLDPFQRQIYAVLRNAKENVRGESVWVSKMTIQTGIDGYLAIAERSGDFAGVDDIVFDTEDGDHPNRATATVWRWSNGQRIPFTFTARWREYVQEKDEYRDNKKTGKKTPSAMWAKMPWTMLGKCALARALRQGFPAQLSGIYTSEEMMQADSSLVRGEIVESDPTQPARPAQLPSPAARPASAPVTPTTRTSVPSPVPAPTAWNPLGDSPFRRRCNVVGVKTVTDVERFLKDAGATTDVEGVYRKDVALAYLVNLEVMQAEASAQARKAAQ